MDDDFEYEPEYDYDDDEECLDAVETQTNAGSSPNELFPALKTYLETTEYAVPRKGNSTDGYGFIDKTGTVVAQGFRGCHSAVASRSTEHVFVWSRPNGIGTCGPQNDPVDSPAQLAALEFILGPDSPWRLLNPAKFNPDIAWAAKYGIIMGDLDAAPKLLLYNFFIATRFISEWKPHCEWWYKMVLGGVHPAVAMAASTFKKLGAYSGYGPGHGALNRNIDPVRLANGDYKFADKKWGRWTGNGRAAYASDNAGWDGDASPFKLPHGKPICRGGPSFPELPADDDEAIAILLKEQERLVLV